MYLVDIKLAKNELQLDKIIADMLLLLPETTRLATLSDVTSDATKKILTNLDFTKMDLGPYYPLTSPKILITSIGSSSASSINVSGYKINTSIKDTVIASNSINTTIEVNTTITPRGYLFLFYGPKPNLSYDKRYDKTGVTSYQPPRPNSSGYVGYSIFINTVYYDSANMIASSYYSAYDIPSIGSSSSSAARIGSSSSSMARIGSSSSSAAQIGSSSSSAARIGSSSSSAAPIGSSSSSAARIGSSSSSAAQIGSSSSSAFMFGSSSSERRIASSSSFLPPLTQQIASSSSSAPGLPGITSTPSSSSSAKPIPNSVVSTSGSTVPLLDPQVYPVSYDDNAPLNFNDITGILRAINTATSMVPRIATVSDLTNALAQGLNWCYPTYAQASSTDTSLQVYAASQPGKCGADSQRQLIKVELDPTKTLAPIYVFILGPKPSENYTTGKLTTTSGRAITIHNFYQPVTVNGFRNLREHFATASSTTITTCYDATNCPIQQNTPVAQTVTIPDTSITSQTTLQDPVLIVGQSRGSSSSSYLASTTAPRGSSSSQAYLAPATTQQGSSSSSQAYSAPPKSVSSSASTASGKVTPQQSTTTQEDETTAGTWSNNASLKRKNTTYIQNITEADPESSQEYVALKQELAALKREKGSATATATQDQRTSPGRGITAPWSGTASQPKSCPPKPDTYDPNANFLVNLFAEIHDDLTRLTRGAQVASRA